MEKVKAKAHIVSKLQEQIPTPVTKLRAMTLCVPAAVCMNRFDWETGQSLGSENKICTWNIFLDNGLQFSFHSAFQNDIFPVKFH